MEALLLIIGFVAIGFFGYYLVGKLMHFTDSTKKAVTKQGLWRVRFVHGSVSDKKRSKRNERKKRL